LNSATFNWTAVADANHYDIRWREQGSSTWNLVTPVLSNTQSLIGFSQSTTYEWEVRSACSSDNSSVSPWSSTEIFVTADPCVVPNNESTSNITSSSATFNWDSVPGAWGYIVRIAEITNFGSWTYDTVNTNTYNAIGLSASTTYFWQVASTCDPNGSNVSAWGTGNNMFTTSAPTPRVVVEEVEIGINLNIYPNPTRGLFNISFVSDEINDFEINIVDAFGKTISHEYKQQFIGEYTKLVDLSNWPRGIYLVQIRTQDSFVTKRIVLQ